MSGLTQRINPTEFEKGVKAMLMRHFKDDGFKVIEERRLYNPYASESIWAQNKGIEPYVVEVYYRDEYLCDVNSKQMPSVALANIEKALVRNITSLHSQDQQKDDSTPKN